MTLLTLILCICMGIKSVNNDQEFHSNDEENRLELKDALSQKIVKDQKVTWGKDCILIIIIALYILCYAKNQHPSILQVMSGYFTYVDNTTKRIIENLYCIGFLVIYKTIKSVLQANPLAINKKL